MHRTDRYGLPLSTKSAAAVRHYRGCVDLLLGENFVPIGPLIACVEADPEFAMGHALLGLLQCLKGDGEGGLERLRAAHELAEETATRREQQHIRILAQGWAGSRPPADALMRRHLEEFPRDALVLCLRLNRIALSSEIDRRTRACDELSALAPAYEEDWFFNSLYGFALSETGRFEAAEQAASRSHADNPRGALAVHCLAHVYHRTGHPADCVHLLAGWLRRTKRRDEQTHLWWHMALAEMAQGHHATASSIHAMKVRPAVQRLTGATALVDMVQLLWRRHLYGAPTRRLAWKAAADRARSLGAGPVSEMMMLHALLALLCHEDKEGVAAWFTTWRARQHEDLVRRLVLPLGEALCDFWEERYRLASEKMEPLMKWLARLAASNEQIELFEDTLIQAYLRAENFRAAQILLRERVELRASARDRAWLAQACCGLGAFDDAASEAQEALSQWCDADVRAPEVVALKRLAGQHQLLGRLSSKSTLRTS
jgi:hypothetical protein